MGSGLAEFGFPGVIPGSKSCKFARDRAVGSNSTSTAYDVALTACPSATAPSNIHERGNAQGVLVIPFGLGSATQSFSMRIIRWYLFKSATGGSSLWIPVIAFEGVCTMGAPVGVASNELLLNTEGLCYTITEDTTLTESTPQVYIQSPGMTGHVGYIMVDLLGCDFFSFDYDLGTVTSANALYGTL